MKKRFGSLWIPGVLLAGMLLGETCFAQQAPAEDTVVAVVAEAADLPLVPPSQWPKYGTFWRAYGGPLLAPTPCPPLDSTTPVYALPNGQFLADESTSLLIAPTEKQIHAQLDALLGLIARAQQTSLNAEMDATLRLDWEVETLDSGGPMFGENYSSSDLWLELVAVTNTPLGTLSASFIVHPPAGQDGQAFDLFMTTNLSAQAPGLNLTNWAYIWRAQPGQTNVTISELTANQAFFLAADTNDLDEDWMSDAYERLCSHTDPNTPNGPSILFQPLSQTVDLGDSVTFAVVAEGASPLRYQWWFGEGALPGRTNSSLRLAGVRFDQQGDYRVEITSPAELSAWSSNATLTVQSPAWWPLVTLTGARQDYSFCSGVTYYIGSRVELHGTTRIEAGSVIKPDWYYPDSTLAVMGTLVCETEDAYYPAFVTSVDDNTVGDVFYYSSGEPASASNGVPYLDLTHAQNANPGLNNLRLRYADQAVAAPAGRRLEVWNCQFVECNAGIVAGEQSTVSLHNVLFGGGGSAVAGTTNFTAITGEQVTAEVTDFWSQSPPAWIRLTNSIILGAVGSGPGLVTDHTAINPAGPVFEASGAGHYYLTNGSAYRRAGSTNVSQRLLAELRQKTTQPPLVFPAMMQMAGEMTLGPQVARYTNGPPDCGYHYPALDYTVAWITNWGTITVLPGTAIGFRNEYSAVHDVWTWWGFDLREGSAFVSRGFPDRPTTFVDVQFVQEQLTSPCIAAFMPDYWPGGGPNVNVAPTLDLRFSRFYAHPNWYHVWGGYDEGFIGYAATPASLLYWTMRDCELHGGRVNLGNPDDGWFFGAPWDYYYGAGVVSWFNNLFENVSINLDPTYYWVDGATVNCDMQIEARNNLVRWGLWFHLEPIPATAGNWVFKDNLFDKVNFVQNTNTPIEFDYNGYWPLTQEELNWLWYYYPWYAANSGQLLATTNGGGSHESVLTAPPPYEAGPLGKYYLPFTALYHAGSRTVAEAGLWQYTTRADQTKAGEESPPGHNVDIGLHYVAVTNLQPRDTDGDEVADYVEDANGNGTVEENETSPLLVQTISGVLDSTNSVYDDVDLDGDGMVGRIEKVLETDSLVADNPLTLTQVITGEEPDIATFEVPVRCSALTNDGSLELDIDGGAAQVFAVVTNGDGRCHIRFNTTFIQPGQRFLAARFNLCGLVNASDGTIGSASSSPLCFSNNNNLRFDPSWTLFGDSAILYAETLPDIPYTVTLYNSSNDLVYSTNGIADGNGIIINTWDLMDQHGNPFTEDTVRATFTIPSCAISGDMVKDSAEPESHLLILDKIPWGELEGCFNVAYATTTDPALQLIQDCAFQFGVVDILLNPDTASLPEPAYGSTFNKASQGGLGGYAGYIDNWLTAGSFVLSHLNDRASRNFHFFGHGDVDDIGAGLLGVPGYTWSIKRTFVADTLGNKIDPQTVSFTRRHPYRVVFMNSCRSAANLGWATAFGIPERIIKLEGLGIQFIIDAQAFAGWATKSWAPVTFDGWLHYQDTMAFIWTSWMSSRDLQWCLSRAQFRDPTGTGNPILRQPLGGPEGPGARPILRIYGYPTIKRTGWN
jgi:hypothetical protein